MRKVNNQKMKATSNRKNIKRFKELLPDFFYTSSTANRIIKSLNPLQRGFKHRYGDAVYRVDQNDLRAWYPLEIDAEDNKAYMLYQYFLRRACHPYVYKYNLLSYSVFQSGRVSDGKQEFKLFKFILNNGILEDRQINEITQYRIDGPLWLCISRNPIDMLFCSTGQSYKSCMGLESDHNAAFYMSCAALCSDPNRAIVFITPGKIKRYKIHGLEFKHFRYIQRNFTHLVNNDQIFIDRSYPGNSFDMRDYMARQGYKIADNEYQRYTSRFHFIPPKFEDNQEALPYFDHIGCYFTENKKGNVRVRIDTDGGTGGQFAFNWEDGFEALTYFEDLDGRNFRCVECGDRIDEDHAIYVEDVGDLCENCFADGFFFCWGCNEIESRDDGHEVDGRLFCDRCFEDRFFTCDICGEAWNRDDLYITEDGDNLCPDCYDDEVMRDCNICGDKINTEDDHCSLYNNEWLCPDCFDAKIEAVFNLMPSWMRQIQASKDIMEAKSHYKQQHEAA